MKNVKAKGLIVTLLAMVLASCVTVSDTSKPKIDKQKILDSNLRLGMAYLEKGQRDNAIRAFTKALESDKRSAEAYQGMAMIHQLNGETELAEKNFKKAIKGRAKFSYSAVLFSYGRFLQEQERCDEAFQYFEKASADLTYNRRVNALFNLGLCAAQLGDEKRAFGAFEHALNINNKFAAAALELAHYRFEDKNYAESKRYLDIYTRNARQSARSLWLGIRIERIFGNKDKEASYALALKNLHPYSREYLEYKNLLESEK